MTVPVLSLISIASQDLLSSSNLLEVYNATIRVPSGSRATIFRSDGLQTVTRVFQSTIGSNNTNSEVHLGRFSGSSVGFFLEARFVYILGDLELYNVTNGIDFVFKN